MAPKSKVDMSLLFHPKKNKKNTPTSSPRPPPPTNSAPLAVANVSLPNSPVKSKPSPKPSSPKKTTVDDDEADMKLPEGPFQEFRITSSALNGWKYDVMKFDSRKSVDILRWQGPIKLNRKDLRKEDPSLSGAGQAVRPMLGPDGQPVIGPDGKTVMVDSEGRPVTENGLGSGGKGKGPANGRKKFQKKTRQVFLVPEETRNLRREERYPWVIEDASGQEVWTAQLDDLGKAETHAFFMPAANDVFKFVPSHRYYKFQKKVKHDMPTDTSSVESAYQKSLKRDPSTWLHQRNGKAPSAATAAMFKAEAEGVTVAGGSGSLVHSSQQSLGPGGRRLKAVDSGADGLFGDDDEDGEAAKRRARDLGGEGDLDEVEFEDDFADDEEKMEVDDPNDEETKAVDERLKKEYKSANKTLTGDANESDDEEGKPGMSKQAKRMQKMLRSREGNNAYESEEEEDNPYASSQEEEEEEEEVVTQTGPAVQQQLQAVKPGTPKPDSEVKPTPQQLQVNGTHPNATGSRASSPVPGLGGHSVVAKRATSPKAPKLKTSNSGSRSGSPLASRASSPVSPGATTPASPGSVAVNGTAGSNSQQQSQLSKKRKADDSSSPTITSPTSTNGLPKPKKRKGHPGPGAAAVAVPTGPLEDRLLIEWLKNTPMANASTRECIQYFTPYLTDEEKKARFTVMVKEVAQLKNGVLVLRSQYRDSPTPSTPTASG